MSAHVPQELPSYKIGVAILWGPRVLEACDLVADVRMIGGVMTIVVEVESEVTKGVDR